jgi:hypothetical protein
MVSLTSLAVPIVLSAAMVFLASFVIHMVLPIHRGDLRKVPKEDAVLDALRPFHLEPGDYALPHAGSPAAMKDPAFIDRMTKGPVALLTVSPSGPPAMGGSLALWFVYIVAVSICAAYVAGRALGPGAHYLEVFRFAGCAAFLAYSGALAQNSIWWKRRWSSTLKSMADGLVYAGLTAGTFGWLWPR